MSAKQGRRDDRSKIFSASGALLRASTTVLRERHAPAKLLDIIIHPLTSSHVAAVNLVNTKGALGTYNPQPIGSRLKDLQEWKCTRAVAAMSMSFHVKKITAAGSSRSRNIQGRERS